LPLIWAKILVNALASLTTDGTDFGADVTVSWMYPTALPANWQLFLFKKAGAAVSDDTISGYFDGSVKPADLSNMGIYVFINLPNGASRITDLTVLSGVRYYYTGVIKDLDGTDFSASVTANFTPTPKLIFNTLDTKSAVVRAFEKTIDVISASDGSKLVVGKDFKVLRSFPMDKGITDFGVVQRTPGRPLVRQLSDSIYEVDGFEIKGETDVDNFEFHWCSTEPLRRDQMTNLFRVARQVSRFYLMKLGNDDIKDARFTFTGDSEGSLDSKTVLFRGTMMVQVDVETQVQIGEKGEFNYNYLDEYQVDSEV